MGPYRSLFLLIHFPPVAGSAGTRPTPGKPIIDSFSFPITFLLCITDHWYPFGLLCRSIQSSTARHQKSAFLWAYPCQHTSYTEQWLFNWLFIIIFFIYCLYKKSILLTYQCVCSSVWERGGWYSCSKPRYIFQTCEKGNQFELNARSGFSIRSDQIGIGFGFLVTGLFTKWRSRHSTLQTVLGMGVWQRHSFAIPALVTIRATLGSKMNLY